MKNIPLAQEITSHFFRSNYCRSIFFSWFVVYSFQKELYLLANFSKLSRGIISLIAINFRIQSLLTNSEIKFYCMILLTELSLTSRVYCYNCFHENSNKIRLTFDWTTFVILSVLKQHRKIGSCFLSFYSFTVKSVNPGERRSVIRFSVSFSILRLLLRLPLSSVSIEN